MTLDDRTGVGTVSATASTDDVTSRDVFGLDCFVPGAAETTVRRIDFSRIGTAARSVVWVELDDVAEPARLDAATAARMERGVEAALDQRVPLVMVMSTSGTDIEQGMTALHGWGRVASRLAACSGVVPTIAIVDGPAVSGPALLLGLMDMTIMTERSSAFVNGPVMVEQFTGIGISVDELGGAATHARYTGVATLVVEDRAAAIAAAIDLLGYLPDNVDNEPHRWPSSDPPGRSCAEAAAQIPETSTGSYDVRHVVGHIVDEDSVVELRDRWAANVVTAFATIDGRPVGIVANQPMVLAGTLDIPASQKAARFVAFCDAFNIGIITFVDTPGFYPGKDLEWRGMIRHGAQLVYAYARASVPRICVILRKSYGGAYIVMDSKTMGNDICIAWPWAEIAVMGAGQAAAILARRNTPEEKAQFELDYSERLLNPYVAAERGFIDAVVDPADTRAEICAALEILSDKREQLVERKHGNSPF
jgi:acetyl-CoA carboxylase carboxyltransferase component